MQFRESVYENVETLDTPVVIVDLDVVERNLARTAEKAKARGVALRPHIKTHKSPYFAHRQLAHGATGVAVATIGEAEVMVDGGVTDVLLAYPPVGVAKLLRLAGLLERATVTVSLDGLEAAGPLSRMAVEMGHTVSVYVDIDTGLRRMGLPPGKPSVDLALAIHELPGLQVVGVMSHCGHIGSLPPDQLKQGAIHDAEALVMTANVLRDRGVPVEVVSPGSTVGTPFAVTVDGVTEVRPGTYIFNDVNTVTSGAATINDCAVTILTTVVSTPGPDRAVIDAGSKVLARDPSSRREGFGFIKEHPSLVIRSLSEEHGVIALNRRLPVDGSSGDIGGTASAVSDDEAPVASLRVGDQLRVVPNHVCPAVNLTDHYVALRGGRVVGAIPVAARGRVR